MINIGWEERVYPAAKIAVVVEGLAAEGVSAAAGLRGTAIAPDELRSPTMLVSVTQVVTAYQNAIRLSRDPNFAFLTGLRTHVASYGMYGFAILSSMDFRQTMQFVVRYHQLATPVVKLRFADEAGRAIWTIDPLPHPAVDARLYRFIVELQFGVHISLHRDVMGSSFHPTSLQVTFDPSRPEAQYEKDFGCPVAFRQPANRLVFDAAWLDGTPELGNEVTYASVLSLCEDLHDRLPHRVGVAGKVRGFLLAKLGRHMSLEDVAAHLGAPERTLRRKLREEGMSFREILDQLRAEVSVKYLRDTQMTMDDIAYALGFSETANFRHAFHRWKRASPREFRQTLQDQRTNVETAGNGNAVSSTERPKGFGLSRSSKALAEISFDAEKGKISKAWPNLPSQWPIGTFCRAREEGSYPCSSGNGATRLPANDWRRNGGLPAIDLNRRCGKTARIGGTLVRQTDQRDAIRVFVPPSDQAPAALVDAARGGSGDRLPRPEAFHLPYAE